MDYFPDTQNIFTINTKVNDNNQEMEDNCYICGDPNNESSINLECNHRFHKNCVDLNNKFTKMVNNKFTKMVNSCPYCRRKINIVPNNVKINKCSAIFKTGKKVGTVCGAYCSNMSSYCKRHSKKT